VRKPHEILTQARLELGFGTLEDAIRHFGWQKHASNVRHHHNGTRGSKGLPKEWARRYAKAYGVSMLELMGVEEDKTPEPYDHRAALDALLTPKGKGHSDGSLLSSPA
jgi:hypothetical protein